MNKKQPKIEIGSTVKRRGKSHTVTGTVLLLSGLLAQIQWPKLEGKSFAKTYWVELEKLELIAPPAPASNGLLFPPNEFEKTLFLQILDAVALFAVKNPDLRVLVLLEGRIKAMK